MDAHMWAKRFDLLGQVEILGMRAEFRSFCKSAPFEEVVLTPAHIFGLNFGNISASWTRRASNRPGEFSAQGPLTYRPRSTSWEVRSQGLPTQSLVCFLDDARLDDEGLDPDVCRVRDFDMNGIMLMIRQEVMAPGFASEAIMESLREILVLKIVKEARGSHSTANGEGALSRSEMERIQECIWSARGKPPTVSQLAALCSMSTRSLLRRLRKSSGKAPSAYIAELQYAKSQWLLGTSQLSIKEVAFETGFATASQFSRAFKRYSGQTPGEFRGSARHRDSFTVAETDISKTDREHLIRSPSAALS